MPDFKKYDYNQSSMVVINFEEQLQQNTFEFTLHRLIDGHIDLTAFYDKYKNDGGGRSAYDPAILLKIILFAYSKGITSNREIQWQCEHNIILRLYPATPCRTLSVLLALLTAIQTRLSRFSKTFYWFVRSRVFWVMSCSPLMAARCLLMRPKSTRERLMSSVRNARKLIGTLNTA